MDQTTTGFYCKSETLAPCAQQHTMQGKQQGRALLPLLLVLLTALALSAAVWQWQRAQLHGALAFDSRQAKQVNLNDLKSLVSGSNHSVQPSLTGALVAVSGEWVPNTSVFVAPRMVNAQSGAWVIDVLKYQQGKLPPRYIAVHRGWLPHASPTQLPDLPALPLGMVHLTGQLQAQLPQAFELKLPRYLAGTLWPNYAIAAHAALVNLPLEPNVLVQAPQTLQASMPMEIKLHRDNPSDASASWQQKADKNLGYAMQWLGLALVGLFGLGWMWRSYRRDRAIERASTVKIAP